MAYEGRKCYKKMNNLWTAAVRNLENIRMKEKNNEQNNKVSF